MKIGNQEYFEIKRGEIGKTAKDYPVGCFVNYEIETENCSFHGKEYLDIEEINRIIEQLKVNRKGQHEIKVGYDGDLNIRFQNRSGAGAVQVFIEAKSVYNDKSNQFREQITR